MCKKRLAAALLALLMFVVGACGGGDGNSSSLGANSSSTDSSRDEESSRPEESAEVSREESREESSVAEETPPTEQTGNLNPLTGLADLSDEAVGKRPVAIVINNIKDSLPQIIPRFRMSVPCGVRGPISWIWQRVSTRCMCM